MAEWMLYGATGYTGKLIAREALQRGHRPLLAGRSPEKLVHLADELGLEWTAINLDDAGGLCRGLERVRAVFHAAGPFTYTARPMIQACLATGVHYLDITGEIPVLQYTFSQGAAAQQKEVVLISGAGFDVIPSDCLALHVAHQVGQATHLETAVAALGSASQGTQKSALEILSLGGLVRREGDLIPYSLGKGVRSLRFVQKTRTVMPAPWGDLVTAYHSTGAQNITCYLTIPRRIAPWVRFGAPLAKALVSLKPIRRLAANLIERFSPQPSIEAANKGRSQIWARAQNQAGNEAQAWLETMEAYIFTAVAGVRGMEALLEGKVKLSGALSPAQAFGPDFILELPETRRID